jgi:hypothetical protein
MAGADEVEGHERHVIEGCDEIEFLRGGRLPGSVFPFMATFISVVQTGRDTGAPSPTRLPR